MANPEHLKILKQGIEVWNQWRKQHPVERPDLGRAYLERMDLREMLFNNADLRGANLSGALCQGTDFVYADLSDADLPEAQLKRAYLFEANLSEADLHNADLQEASLQGTQLHNARIYKANLRKANLNQATLTQADLRGACLAEAVLERANLASANLTRADLTTASLRWAVLRKANLTDANLRGSDLTGVNLIDAVLHNATVTGALLYGSARDDWSINGIVCKYVFWDKKGEHRTPQDRNFRPGEFEELYKALPTIEYYFEQGFTPLDPLIMDQVVQAINQKHPEFELKLDSFHSRGQPHAVFTVIHKDHTATALQQITAAYEARLAALEGKQEQLMALFGQLTSHPQPQLISQCQQVVIAGRDYFEQINGHAQVNTRT